MPYTDKKVLLKITRTIQAWETLRPKKSFAGMTLNQFKATVQPALDARVPIAPLRDELKDKIKKRQEVDGVAMTACLKVANAVRGDVEEGEDSGFYKALGYIPKSERRSGLHRNITPVPLLKKAA